MRIPGHYGGITEIRRLMVITGSDHTDVGGYGMMVVVGTLGGDRIPH